MEDVKEDVSENCEDKNDKNYPNAVYGLEGKYLVTPANICCKGINVEKYTV